jgi:hypothetical protein
VGKTENRVKILKKKTGKTGKTRASFSCQGNTGRWCGAGINNKSLMFKKSTNDLLGWVVEKIGIVPGTVAPSFGSKKEQVTARHQYIIPDVAGNIISSCC